MNLAEKSGVLAVLGIIVFFCFVLTLLFYFISFHTLNLPKGIIHIRSNETIPHTSIEEVMVMNQNLKNCEM